MSAGCSKKKGCVIVSVVKEVHSYQGTVHPRGVSQSVSYVALEGSLRNRHARGGGAYARWVEWLGYVDWTRAPAMTLPRSLAHLEGEIEEKKCVEAGDGLEAPDVHEEVQNAEVSEARRHGGWEFQQTCLEVLPGEDRSLPFRAVPPVDEEPPHC